MKRHTLNPVLGAAVLFWAGALALQADVVVPVASDTFETGVDGWQGKAVSDGGASAATLSQATLGGSNALQITVSGFGEDYVYDDDNLGNYGGDGDYVTPEIKAISFDFWADATAGGSGSFDYPGALDVYFMAANSNVWTYSIDVTGYSQGWNTGNYITLDFGSGWFSPGLNSTDFQNDLGDVDEVGLLVTYQSWSGQEYGIDNYTLHAEVVPEPSTLLICLTALVSLRFYRGVAEKRRKG